MFQRLGEFVVRRARWVLVVSLIALIGGGVLASSAFGKLKDQGFDDPNAEATAAAEQLDEKFGGNSDFVLLVHAAAGSVDSAAATTAGQELTRQLQSDARLRDVVSYFDTHAPAMKSADGDSAIILVSSRDEEQKPDAIIDAYRRDGPAISVQFGGQQPTFAAVGDQIAKDLTLAEAIAIPLTLALLVLAFGNVIAALLTLSIGGISILGTFAELSVFGSLTDVSIYAVNMTTAMGLGLAMDYGLLLVSRFREERSGGALPDAAIVKAVATAGRTIAFSASTVAAALAALVVFPPYFLRSFAYAGMGVVLISAVGALFVLPALLAVLGEKADALKVPGVRGIRGDEAQLWGRIAGFAMRRPLLTGVPVVAVLLLAAAPLLNVQFGMPDDRVLPTSSEARQVGDVLRSEFSGGDSDAMTVVTTSGVDAGPLADYAMRLSQLPHVALVESSVGTYADGTLTSTSPADVRFARPDAQRLSIVTDVDSTSIAARDLVEQTRAVPAPAGTRALIGGSAAELNDTLASIGAKLPLAVGWIVLTTFVLLFVFTGSIVQPLRALVLNALSLGATLGAMVFVYQEGHFADLLGFTPAPLDVSMLLLLFCITFGLSMDYEVFVVSRIKEMHDRGASTREAVQHGLAHTGRLVTTAAGLISISFFAFVISDVRFIQFFGLGTGLAIIIDATLVRGVLVPVAMRLLGKAAWYAPKPLRVLHARVGLAEA